MRKHQTQTEDFFKIRDHYSTKVSRSQMRTKEPSQTGGVWDTTTNGIRDGVSDPGTEKGHYRKHSRDSEMSIA